MSFCCRETVDITSKTVQKKQDSCIYESCFVAVNHGYFPMMPYVAFTFRFNEYNKRKIKNLSDGSVKNFMSLEKNTSFLVRISI